MGFEQYLALLAKADQAVSLAALAAFHRLIVLIRQGLTPQAALTQVMTEFRGAAIEGFREALESILQQSISTARAANWKVGKVKLSTALYADSKAVSATVRVLIHRHLKGPQDARALAKTLYEGYDYKADPLNVVKPLPDYLQRTFDRFAAMQLKTPALRAAYLQAITKAESGAGQQALEKALRVAFYERNRYLANRITQTELHRAYTDRQARELMQQDRVRYVRYQLSGRGKRAVDICDAHARADRYGLGPGIYPKADAPMPPLHPLCRCICQPYLLVPTQAKAAYNPAAERAFLRSLPPEEARQVAGSQERLARVLKGESLEAIYNEGVDEVYRWRRMGVFERDV